MIGTYKLTIPSSWKVTYGLLHPGMKSGYGKGNVLRIYESETKQRALFNDVLWFRDDSLPIELAPNTVETLKSTPVESWATPTPTVSTPSWSETIAKLVSPVEGGSQY